MSNLDDATLQHMVDIVYTEHRPFCYKDFLKFTIDGQSYQMTHGTFRNKIQKFIKEEKVEVAYHSSITFYTLKGTTFNKSMTANHMGISLNNKFYRIIEDLPLDKSSVHNIRLRFEINHTDVWNIFSLDSSFNINSVSKDIHLTSWQIDNDIFVKVTLHRTNTVSINIGCSLRPFPLDLIGIIALSNLLTRIEERISRLLQDKFNNVNIKNRESNKTESIIPNYKEWIVTMWHFNADSMIEYSGERFSIKWEVAENTIVQIYTKRLKDNKCKIRLERQEYPNKTLLDAVEQKISENNKNTL